MKMALAQIAFLLMSVTLSLGQRGSYAGTKPIGYPEVQKPEELGNRFGDGESTTVKLPLEALGDKDLVDRLSQLPQDHQAFWLLNAQALQDNRDKPQVYPSRPGSFIDASSNVNSVTQNSNPTTTGNLGSQNPLSGFGGNAGSQNPLPGFGGNAGSQNLLPGLGGNVGSQNPLSGFGGNAEPQNPLSGFGGNAGPQTIFGFGSNAGSGFTGQAPQILNSGSQFPGNGNIIYPNGFNGNPGSSLGNRHGEVTPESIKDNHHPHPHTHHKH